jgi:hypothetical protein
MLGVVHVAPFVAHPVQHDPVESGTTITDQVEFTCSAYGAGGHTAAYQRALVHAAIVLRAA